MSKELIFYTVSNIDGRFKTIQEAREAWEQMGRPKQRGSSVWISEHRDMGKYAETIRDITIQEA